jgi:hypothetical protein
MSRSIKPDVLAVTVLIVALACSGSPTTTVDTVSKTAPEPGADDVILWQDNFNVSTLADLDRSYIWAGQRQLVTNGRAGSAVRFFYNAGNYDNIIEQTVPASKNIYIRYWYRLSQGADPSCGDRGGSGMKWFMAHRPESLQLPRYTFGVGHLDGPPSVPRQTGLEFTVHDNGSNDQWNPFIQNVAKSPKFGSTNDGAWHEYTVHIVTDRGDGSGTGYEQIWVDGVLVLDDSGFNYHHEPTGVSRINFPGNVVDWYSGCDFTIDVDDFAIWHK